MVSNLDWSTVDLSQFSGKPAITKVGDWGNIWGFNSKDDSGPPYWKSYQNLVIKMWVPMLKIDNQYIYKLTPHLIMLLFVAIILSYLELHSHFQ